MGFLDRIRALFADDPETEGAESYFAEMPAVETVRLILRKARTGDAEDIYAYSKDPEVARHVLWTAHESIGDSRAYIRYLQSQYRNGEPGSYVIERKADRRVIGTVGWMSFTPEHHSAEIGYSIARDCWNQGIMTEALACMLRISFESLGLNRVYGYYELDNPASRRVMEKCGMALEGILRQSVYNKGRFSDTGLCAIVRSDWLHFTER